MPGDEGLLRALIGGGRPALSQFLPHDVGHLGTSAEELCRVADCRVVRFMFHDRVALAGTFGAGSATVGVLLTLPAIA